MLYDQPADGGYRRLYHELLRRVDTVLALVLDGLDASGMADETIVVFTSDHGTLLGAHGGLVQKWHNAYDEALHVPLLVSGPGITPDATGFDVATSHVDLVPTLLGLAGIDRARAAETVAAHHTEAQELPGPRPQPPSPRQGNPRRRRRARLLHDRGPDQPRGLAAGHREPRALRRGRRTRQRRERRRAGWRRATVARRELWKLNHYYERLDDWYSDQGIPASPLAAPPAAEQWELHNLTCDPEERDDLAGRAPVPMSELQSILEAQRDAKRRLPVLR